MPIAVPFSFLLPRIVLQGHIPLTSLLYILKTSVIFNILILNTGHAMKYYTASPTRRNQSGTENADCRKIEDEYFTTSWKVKKKNINSQNKQLMSAEETMRI